MRGLDRLDAQLLLLHALGRDPNDRAWLLAHDTDALDAAASTLFDIACARRLQGEPVAYILGHKEFFGLQLHVDARVLVPRPDTETLVSWALEHLPAQGTLLDLGTGSGAIALALQQARADASVTALDRSDRIRTYNFPQGRFTDHRINLTLYKLGFIMEGDLDDVVQALQAARAAEQLAELEVGAV